jgi:hypothetical protein
LVYDWQRQIAEATSSEWITVAAYIAAMACTAFAARRARQWQTTRETAFWWATTVLLGLLAINDLLDLQTLLTEQAKVIAKADGWYEARRDVQFWFVVALAGGSALAGLIGLRWLRRTALPVRIALAGLAFIAVFVLARAASFHHLDHWLGSGWSRLDYGAIQEIGGIAIIAAAALGYGRRPRRLRRRRSRAQ